VPHSSVEAGERALPDPVERRGCRVVDQTSEPRRGHRASSACHQKPSDRVRDSATTSQLVQRPGLERGHSETSQDEAGRASKGL